MTTTFDSMAAEHNGLRYVEPLLALIVLLLAGLVIQDWSSQPASRYLLTAAAVDDHSLQLDPYEDYLGLDQARYGGHIYSDKAPYQPLLAAPAYQAYRLAGGDPVPAGFAHGRFQDGTNYGLWWVTLWSSVLPAMALAVVVRRLVARTHPDLATRVALATMLGTTILPFAGWLFGHVMAALFVTGAWYLLRGGEPATTTSTMFLSGCLLGLGIGAEYAVGVIALVALGHIISLRRWPSVVALSAGTVVAALPLFLYNWLVFDNPLEVSYQGHLKSFEGEGALGVYNLKVPSLDELTKTMFGNRGLFVITPIVLLAVVGAVLAIVNRLPTRRDAWLGLAALVGMVAISTGIDGYGGDSPGPRYLIPALPLLAVPMAEAWRRLPALCTIAAGVGGFIMWTAMVTTPAIDPSEPQPLRIWIDRLRGGDLTTNVLTGDDHGWVLLLAAAAALAVLVHVLRTERVHGVSTTQPRLALGVDAADE